MTLVYVCFWSAQWNSDQLETSFWNVLNKMYISWSSFLDVIKLIITATNTTSYFDTGYSLTLYKNLHYICTFKTLHIIEPVSILKCYLFSVPPWLCYFVTLLTLFEKMIKQQQPVIESRWTFYTVFRCAAYVCNLN